MIQKGFNSDISKSGKSFHVQTEDWGFDNPWIVTRVFCGGALISSIKTPYSQILRQHNVFLLMRNRPILIEAIRTAMHSQHSLTLRKVESGELVQSEPGI